MRQRLHNLLFPLLIILRANFVRRRRDSGSEKEEEEEEEDGMNHGGENQGILDTLGKKERKRTREQEGEFGEEEVKHDIPRKICA